MKKITSLLLAVLGCATAVSASADVKADVVATADNALYDFVADGIYYKIMGNGEYLQVSSKTTTAEQETSELSQNVYKGDIVIPDSVFVESLNRRLPVKSIREGAFYGMPELTSVVCPPTLTEIGESAFSFCERLDVLDLSSTGVKVLPNNMCGKCFSLHHMYMPEKLTGIDASVFFSCSLTKELAVPESVAYIGMSAFGDVLSLEQFRMSKSLKSIGNGAFYGVEPLYFEWRSDSLESIGDYAFWTQDSVMILPKTIKHIGQGWKATELRELICKATDPAQIELADGAIAESGINTQECTLYVPAESVDLYRNAPQWSAFARIAPLEQSGLRTVTVADDAEGTPLFDLSGRPVTAPARGHIYVGADGRKVLF